MSSNPFNLELFNPAKHECSTFDCKEPSINDYLNKYAKQDIKRDFTRMHVISYVVMLVCVILISASLVLSST